MAEGGSRQPSAWKTSLDLLHQQSVTTIPERGIKRSHTDFERANTTLSELTNGAAQHLTRDKSSLKSVANSSIEASPIQDTPSRAASLSLPNAARPIVSSGLPRPSQNPLLLLSNPQYGLPERLVRNFCSLGINCMYPWQSSCLLGRGLLSGERNLVYTAPTGGGKSLVADVLMLKHIVENPTKKALLVLPYVALIQEKLRWLRKVVEDVEKGLREANSDERVPPWLEKQPSGIRIVGCFGGSKVRASWRDFDIAVCTIEKANGLVNAAIADGTIVDLGVVVLDELHMIDDDHRGYLMELVASKLLCLETAVQIVGMSATMNNTEVLAKWLNARYYNTKYVPVPIEENLVFENVVYPVCTSSAFFRTASQLQSTQSILGSSPTRYIQKSKYLELQPPLLNAVVALAVETAAAGFGALVFCGSRQTCQNMASLISEAMPLRDTPEAMLERRREVIWELRNLPVGPDDTLEKTVMQGVAFHHAGLTAEERDIVAGAYDKGTLRVIVATCSLAAGINLPARRVILHGARMGRDLIGPAMLRQMRGRAGRKGKDEVGESYLCCQKDDLDSVLALMQADLPCIDSGLQSERRGVQRALLEVITIGLATHTVAIHEYVRRTLLYHTSTDDSLMDNLEPRIQELVDSELVKIDRHGGYEATALSKATIASHLTPEDGLFIYSELRAALKAFVMDGEMHIFYTFTPVWSTGNVDIDWAIFRKEIDGLDESGLRVLHFVGVNPARINRLANSGKPMSESTEDEARQARIYRRFYTALQLRDLCNEMPIHEVARKYQVARGAVQTLSQICEGFASSMIQFCGHMGWGMLQAALEHMVDRLKAGARADLLELAQIPFVKSRTARVFWENGFRSLRAVAEASAEDLLPVLLLAQPKKLNLDHEAELKRRGKLLLRAEIIIGAANRLFERQNQFDLDEDM